MRVYYLYEKSSKKSRELDDIVESLRECLEPSDMPGPAIRGGNKPLRACGTRFVAHKVAALCRLVDRFGAYVSHLQELIDSPSTKSVDKAKLTGYLRNWCTGKMLFGCAFFHDLLKPASLLCKALQADEICVVTTIEALLRASTAIDAMATTPFEDLPTVKLVRERLRVHDSGATLYQGMKVAQLEQGVELIERHCVEYTQSVLSCLQHRVKAQHVQLLHDALMVLATHGWNKFDDAASFLPASHRLAELFRVPLEAASVCSAVLDEEWEDLLTYSRRYLKLTDSHLVVWWKLFNVAEFVRWKHVLKLVEVLFCLPMSNSRIERVFSTLKHVKINRRCSLGEGRLNSLVRIAVEGPPPAQWNAMRAVELWLADRCRRATQDTRAAPRPTSIAAMMRQQEPAPAQSSSFDLSDWDAFLSHEW